MRFSCIWRLGLELGLEICTKVVRVGVRVRTGCIVKALL